MATQRGPKIVRDGLVLCLDAADRKSYPGSGTVWNDLSGNNKNGTLTNFPIAPFDGSNGGNIVFDGTDDYVVLNSSIALGNTFTINAFIKLTNNNSDTSIIGTDANGADNWLGINTNKIYALFTQTADVNNNAITGNTTLLNNQWYHVTITINTSTVNVYLNGVQDATPKTVAFTIGDWSDLFAIGRRSVYVAQRYFLGNIAYIQAYNRTLSASEILQNFNAQRGRFGI
jgi:hypothetical protein